MSGPRLARSVSLGRESGAMCSKIPRRSSARASTLRSAWLLLFGAHLELSPSWWVLSAALSQAGGRAWPSCWGGTAGELQGQLVLSP